MDYNLSNKSVQFMLFQNKAYHEERLIHLKAHVDNKLNDFSHILERNQPNRKHYLEREKQKEILSQNHYILDKIHSIIYERNNQKENGLARSKLPKSVEQRLLNQISGLNSFGEENKVRSMNINVRKKEMDRINDDNRMILSRLQTTKPTIKLDELKQHAKNSKKYGKRLRSFDHKHRPKNILCIFDRNKINPILTKLIKRHEVKDSNEVKKYNEVERENSNYNLESIIEKLNEDQMGDTLPELLYQTRASSSQVHKKPTGFVIVNPIRSHNQSPEGEQEYKSGNNRHIKPKKPRNFTLKPLPGQKDSYNEYYKNILNTNPRLTGKVHQTLSPSDHKKEDLIVFSSGNSIKVINDSAILKNGKNLIGYDTIKFEKSEENEFNEGYKSMILDENENEQIKNNENFYLSNAHNTSSIY